MRIRRDANLVNGMLFAIMLIGVTCVVLAGKVQADVQLKSPVPERTC